MVSPRTGVSDRIVLTHCTDTRCGCVWCGNVLLLFVLSNLVLGGGGKDSLMTKSHSCLGRVTVVGPHDDKRV